MMSEQNTKKSFFARLRNNFITGIVVLIPIGITLYLTLFIKQDHTKPLITCLGDEKRALTKEK